MHESENATRIRFVSIIKFMNINKKKMNKNFARIYSGKIILANGKVGAEEIPSIRWKTPTIG